MASVSEQPAISAPEAPPPRRAPSLSHTRTPPHRSPGSHVPSRSAEVPAGRRGTSVPSGRGQPACPLGGSSCVVTKPLPCPHAAIKGEPDFHRCGSMLAAHLDPASLRPFVHGPVFVRRAARSMPFVAWRIEQGNPDRCRGWKRVDVARLHDFGQASAMSVGQSFRGMRRFRSSNSTARVRAVMHQSAGMGMP